MVLLKKTNYNAKIADIEGKNPDVSNLATKTALTTVENKIPSVSSLVKETDNNSKVAEIENKLNNLNCDKYITTPESDTLAVDVFNARLSQADLVTKIAKNKTKNKSVENEFKKFKPFDLGYFIGKSHFEEDGVQNYLVFQQIRRYFEKIAIKKYILSWKYKGLSDETITPYSISDNSLTPLIDHYGSKVIVKFNKGCLK